MKYHQWLNEWLATCVKPAVKSRTLERYKAIVRLQIVPGIGGYDMAELTPFVLQKFTAELSEKYSSNTVTGIINVIKSSLTRAQKMERVATQYSDVIEYPKSTEKTVESFTRAEQKKIEQYVFNSYKPKNYGLVLCLYTGLRVGELLALEWGDIDFTHRRITVTKTCTDKWVGGVYKKVIDTPKTNSSRRIIPLPAQLVPYLKVIKKQSKSNFVISGTNGEDVSVRSYQKTFAVILKKLDIGHRGFHALRHTFATRALECGMDVKSLSGILGHKSPVVTLKRYAHSFWEHQNAMMNRIGKMLTADAAIY
ncbi:MAG: site-specific integrase [Clostridiales bacterium]|nr:site-specific integrase [Clostridiales bacterium]